QVLRGERQPLFIGVEPAPDPAMTGAPPSGDVPRWLGLGVASCARDSGSVLHPRPFVVVGSVVTSRQDAGVDAFAEQAAHLVAADADRLRVAPVRTLVVGIYARRTAPFARLAAFFVQSVDASRRAVRVAGRLGYRRGVLGRGGGQPTDAADQLGPRI